MLIANEVYHKGMLYAIQVDCDVWRTGTMSVLLIAECPALCEVLAKSRCSINSLYDTVDLGQVT